MIIWSVSYVDCKNISHYFTKYCNVYNKHVIRLIITTFINRLNAMRSIWFVSRDWCNIRRARLLRRFAIHAIGIYKFMREGRELATKGDFEST